MMRPLLEPPNFLQESDVQAPSMESFAKNWKIVALELEALNDESDEQQTYEIFNRVIELNKEIVAYNRSVIKYNEDNIRKLKENR